MVKATNNARERQLEFAECERRFRKSTVEIARDFSSTMFEVWSWTKKRMNLVFAEGVVLSRHNNEAKQRNYIESGAEGIWSTSSQNMIDFVRVYVTSMIESLPDEPCPNCGEPIKVFSNQRASVVKGWERFWQMRRTDIRQEQELRAGELVEMLRTARQVFKMIPDPATCYTSDIELLPQFSKSAFLPELESKVAVVTEQAAERYIKSVMHYLPDLVMCKNNCLSCKADLVFMKNQ